MSAAPRAERAAVPAARLAGPAVLLLALLPALWLVARTALGDLGSDPVETLELATGHWALRFLGLTLLVTPLRKLTGWSWLAKQRRTLGLAAFGYATVHLLVYVVIDMGLYVGDIVEDVIEHPYITIGMATWLLLLPLALTSTKASIRRLGGQRWNRLHQLTYLCAVTGVVHYLWAVKRDVTGPVLYATAFAVLLGWRLWTWAGRRRERAARAA